jgi:hypothetical protein
MSYLIDDVARTLAGPMPRRKALRLLSTVVAGGILSTLGLKQARAQSKPCKTGTTACGSVCCKQNETCCNNTVCCAQNETCANGRCGASKK